MKKGNLEKNFYKNLNLRKDFDKKENFAKKLLKRNKLFINMKKHFERIFYKKKFCIKENFVHKKIL